MVLLKFVGGKARHFCCSSPAAIMYWAVVSVFAWIGLGALGLFWYPLHATSATTILFAMSAGCFANWRRNRTYHCYVDGPLLLAGATAFLLRQLHLIQFASLAVWLPLGLGIGISFYLEWRVAVR
jgi:hypothetical protein